MLIGLHTVEQFNLEASTWAVSRMRTIFIPFARVQLFFEPASLFLPAISERFEPSQFFLFDFHEPCSPSNSLTTK